MKKIQELKPIRHYELMPNCEYEATPRLRFYKRKNKDGSITEILEQMFLDGYGSLFWAPIPREEE